MTQGCNKSCQKVSSSDSKDAAALVNGKSVSLTNLDEIHKRTLTHMQKADPSAKPDVERKIRGNILLRLIDNELINQKAQSLGVKIEDAEKDQALQTYKARVGGPKGYDALLQQGVVTEKQIVDNLMGDLIRTKVLEKMGSAIDISDEEIKAYYEANKQRFAVPDMVHARHLLLKVAKTDSAEKAEEVRKKALSILEEAKKPAANFDEIVKKYSEGPSQKQGGDLGFFARGRMVKEFEDAAFSAPLKTPIGPIKTDFGYHIIFVDEKKDAHTASIEEARDGIIESLKQNKQARKSEEIIADLRTHAKVKILDYSMTDQEYENYLKESKN
jgi:parvulin-like peptidyl-prolyl isomerase